LQPDRLTPTPPQKPRTKSWSDGREYQGDILNGEPHGFGRLRYAEGRSYKGQFRFGLFHGRGVQDLGNGGAFWGEFQDGKRHGKGTLRFPDGRVFTGSFLAGKATGHATLRSASNGLLYEGDAKGLSRDKVASQASKPEAHRHRLRL